MNNITHVVDIVLAYRIYFTHLVQMMSAQCKAIISEFTKLQSSEMCRVIGALNDILWSRHNHTTMELETTVRYVLDGNILRTAHACKMLQRLVRERRARERNVRADCVIKQTGSLYDRLRIQSRIARQREGWGIWTPRRGDLTLLNCKWKVAPHISEYSAGRTWIYLGRILNELARDVAPWYGGTLEFTDLNNTFLVHNGWFKDLLFTLARVCKEWYIVLKYHCTWWGPERGYFALTPRYKKIPVDKVRTYFFNKPLSRSAFTASVNRAI